MKAIKRLVNKSQGPCLHLLAYWVYGASMCIFIDDSALYLCDVVNITLVAFTSLELFMATSLNSVSPGAQGNFSI